MELLERYELESCSLGSPMPDHKETLVGAEAICASDDDDSDDVGDQHKTDDLDENGAAKVKSISLPFKIDLIITAELSRLRLSGYLKVMNV